MKRAKLGVVVWRDACLYQANAGIELVEVRTAGWIAVLKDRVVVVNSMTNGEKDVYFVIPKEWVMQIIYVKEVDDGGSKRQTAKG
jgi:hypothetical protein